MKNVFWALVAVFLVGCASLIPPKNPLSIAEPSKVPGGARVVIDASDSDDPVTGGGTAYETKLYSSSMGEVILLGKTVGSKGMGYWMRHISTRSNGLQMESLTVRVDDAATTLNDKTPAQELIPGGTATVAHFPVSEELVKALAGSARVEFQFGGTRVVVPQDVQKSLKETVTRLTKLR
jgi:hypothetical protein